MIDWLARKAWPSYECEDCISMKEHGCQCQYYEAYAPGTGWQPWWCTPLRWILRNIFRRNSR